MFNHNKGYVGYSRSVRSNEAIESYEVPLSLIDKELVHGFLESDYVEEINDLTDENVKFLKDTSIAKWRFVAKVRTYPSSWHHTSSYFNKTDHYSLISIANRIIELKDSLDDEYFAYKNEQKKTTQDITYGVLEVQVWGGSRKRPKLIGTEVVAGIVIGDWLYYKESHKADGALSKYKISANKVNWCNTFDTYEELVKTHKNFKSTKRVFNKLICEKIQK